MLSNMFEIATIIKQNFMQFLSKQFMKKITRTANKAKRWINDLFSNRRHSYVISRKSVAKNTIFNVKLCGPGDGLN